jgi:hypothetical protein
MEDLATKIRQRANAAGISISLLRENAGVSRDWIEKLKNRIKIHEQLKLLENNSNV